MWTERVTSREERAGSTARDRFLRLQQGEEAGVGGVGELPEEAPEELDQSRGCLGVHGERGKPGGCQRRREA